MGGDRQERPGPIRVEVAFARPDQQAIVPVDVPAGCTVAEAIQASGIEALFPEIDLAVNRVGIFGRLVTQETRLEEGDRVEIYRPLKADPRETRRRKARAGRTMRKGD